MKQHQQVASSIKRKPNGIPFVWAHGLMASMAMEEDIQFLDFSALSKTTLVRYDACGHGDSPACTASDQTKWPQLANDMVAIADHYQLDKFVAGGASMGCATALYAGIQNPEKLAGLVLVIPPTAWEARKKTKKVYRFIARLSPFRLVGPLLRTLLNLRPLEPSYLSEHFSGKKDILKKHASAFSRKSPLPVLLGAADSDFPDPSTIKNINIPTLILAWKDDAVHPISIAEELHNLIPESTLHIADSVEDYRNWSQLIMHFIDDLNAK